MIQGICKTCTKGFESHVSSKRKFCSQICAWKSYLKSPSEKIGHSSAERQARHRSLHPKKDLCACGAEKHRVSKLCKDCHPKSVSGVHSPYFKGGYENHLKLNRQRAAQIKIIGDHTPQEWEILKAKYNYMCLCCKQREPEIKLSRDHIMPISKGGSDNISNIQPLCGSCNSIKRDKIISYIEPVKTLGAGL